MIGGLWDRCRAVLGICLNGEGNDVFENSTVVVRGMDGWRLERVGLVIQILLCY